MPTQDTSQIKEKILNFLREEGPNLPVPISRNLKIDSLFTSAFLSELLSNKKIQITSLRVGGSPVYYVPGTEEKLEKYAQYLKPKELEAFNLLKEKKFLIDENQLPAIKIALREIKDFAKYFQKEGKLIWRYFLEEETNYTQPKKENDSNSHPPENKNETLNQTTEKKQETQLSPSFISSVQKSVEEQEKQEIPKEKEEKEKQEAPNEEKKENKEIEDNPNSHKETEKPKELQRIIPEEEKPIFKNPLAQKEKPKKTKEKPKSPFCNKVIEFLTKKGWEILEEIDHKAKEYNCLIQINSQLGPIIFKTQAKDKKTTTESDLTKLLAKSQAIPLPALFISTGDLQKKAKEFLEKYTSVIKHQKIE